MNTTTEALKAPSLSPGTERGWKAPPSWVVFLLIAATFVGMTIWSWGTWPDPIIDFGRELYVPWQLAQGKVLYRDIAYFNGPLSPYLNTIWFTLFGASLRTLVLCNLAILALITVMLYRLMGRIAGRTGAVTATLMFLLLFAFSRYEWIGNSNYVCPYSHETTHGMALALGMILLLDWYLRRGTRRALIFSGLLLGLVFLTKVEIFAAAGAAAMTAMTLRTCAAWRGLARLGADLLTLILPALACPLAAWALLSCAMTTHEALLGVLGSSRYAFNTELSGLLYFKIGSGLLNPIDSIVTLVMVLVGVLALLAIAGLIARIAGYARVQPAGRAMIAVALFAGIVLVLGVFWQIVPWWDLPRPLPLIVVGLGIMGLLRWRRNRGLPDARHQAVLLLVLVIFALVLLFKMILYARLSNYGYFLAMPAGLLAVAALVTFLPDWLERHGASSTVFRGAVAAALLMLVLWHLDQDRRQFAAQSVTVGSAADQFYADYRGDMVNTTVDLLKKHLGPRETVAVLPEGATINFLAGKINPTPYIIFMPSDLIMFGEKQMIDAFAAHPPDYIVLVHKDTWEYGYRFFGKDYGISLMDWIKTHYRLVEGIGSPPFENQKFGIMIVRYSAAKQMK